MLFLHNLPHTYILIMLLYNYGKTPYLTQEDLLVKSKQ